MLDIAYTALLDFLTSVKRRTAKFPIKPEDFVPYLSNEEKNKKESSGNQKYMQEK